MPRTDKALAGLPEPARGFVEAEIAAGNAVIATHVPPAGVVASTYVILAGRVTTRPRSPARADSTQWHFGQLAPGLPAVVVMEAQPIEHDAPERSEPHAREEAVSHPAAALRAVAPRTAGRGVADPAGRIRRFRASMAMDLERWRDGTGYDLAAIDEATPEEREAMLDIVLAHGQGEARDAEAMVRLGGPRAEAALRRQAASGSLLQRLAVLQEAPQWVTDDERTATLVQALHQARAFHGLSATMDLVERWHPAPVIDALWHAARHGAPELAVHAAAMLAWIHGLAAEPFDWSQRPFFLQFGDQDGHARERACHALRDRIRQQPGP